MTQQINLVTDESFSSSQVNGFINDAIAQINIYCKSNFPYIADGDIEYTVIPEKWQRQLFVPYAAGRIKQNDSSQFEYSDWYAQFQVNMAEFEVSHVIPDEYLDLTDVQGPLQTDFSFDGGGW